MNIRNLTPEEIYQLEKQGCRAENWLNVLVHPSFDTHLVWQVHFRGRVSIGALSLNTEGDYEWPEGITYSTICNCSIGDHVALHHVKFISNYTIEDQCRLIHIDSMIVEGITGFGNGTEVNVLNETGGRAIPICEEMNAQMAWLMTHYRHDELFIKQLQKILKKEARQLQSDYGKVGAETIIERCSFIRNVRIGEGAQLSGVQQMEDGTILSEVNAPTVIGENVIARHFIIQEGAHVTDGVMLINCLVGQGVRMGRQFSAEHSLFFANSEMFHGEACSIFAGPYTVSHHKSTLLIAGEYAFFNAGSGTNQSNHMYKLGPMHQGVVERGCKTGSFSYLLWPCQVGPYSVVMGKHSNHFDASCFPFSYITEEEGKSLLTPAMNLFTVGTRRDIYKWPARDKRHSSGKRDLIIFDFYSPFIMQKVLAAIDRLDELYNQTPKTQERVLVNGLFINRLMLKTCRKYYELALNVFLGEGMIVLLNHLSEPFDVAEVQKHARTIDSTSKGEWLDMAGLYVTLSQVEALTRECRNGRIVSLQQLEEQLKSMYDSYRSFKQMPSSRSFSHGETSIYR